MTPQERATKAQQAFAVILKEKGKPMSQLRLLMLQAAHETGGFKSRLSTVNNLSGIKYSPKSAILGESNSGILSPEGNYYSKFDSIDSWARRHYQIVNRGANKPIDAQTIQDFAARLKANKYYTDTLTNYTKGLLSWQRSIDRLPAPILISSSLVLFAVILAIFYFYHVG
jgi:hypothetical protein